MVCKRGPSHNEAPADSNTCDPYHPIRSRCFGKGSRTIRNIRSNLLKKKKKAFIVWVGEGRSQKVRDSLQSGVSAQRKCDLLSPRCASAKPLVLRSCVWPVIFFLAVPSSRKINEREGISAAPVFCMLNRNYLIYPRKYPRLYLNAFEGHSWRKMTIPYLLRSLKQRKILSQKWP